MPFAAFLQRHGVTFYFPEKEFQPATFHYAADCLASGLRASRVPIFSNIENDLFAKREISDVRDGIVVFCVTEKNYSDVLIAAIEQYALRQKFILSMSDTNSSSLTPASVPSLMTHENRFLNFKSPRFPWAFGLTNERVKMVEPELPFETRARVLVRNFSPSSHQSVRNALDLVLLPQLEKFFEIDWRIGGDHFPRLARSVGCLAYGGDLLSNLGRSAYFANLPFFRLFAEHAAFLQEPVTVRWDSWRFWESLAAGCLTFQLDFEKYGLKLPVMPKAWVDYIPVDLSDPKGTVEHLMDLEPRWSEIAANGKRWALQHYTPIPTAQRFLALANELYP